jgi:hypothetical protein
VPDRRHAEAETRRGSRAARIEVATARDYDLGPVAQVLGSHPALVEVVAPHRARDRPVAVTQLEVDLRPVADPRVREFADQRDARERAQLIAQRPGVAANLVRSREARDPGLDAGGDDRPVGLGRQQRIGGRCAHA